MGIEILVVFFAYLLGSVSFSYIITKKIAGIDIRQHGSKNAGATNTLRVLGVWPAIVVLLLDAFKGVVAVLVAMALTDASIWVVLSGLAAIFGHNWPVYYRFKGGKGIATTIGTVATLGFVPSISAGVIAITTTRGQGLAAGQTRFTARSEIGRVERVSRLDQTLGCRRHRADGFGVVSALGHASEPSVVH
jgi:acyl-phosphate glycerol 3-phosphate acyltransferase